MKTYSVTAINKIIKNFIDNEVILEDITVTGELSSFSVSRNIAYFTLKEVRDLLSCVMFNTKQLFSVGDLVQVRGNIKYYPQGGKLHLNALSIELCGQGELYQQFLQLKAKLEAEGLFDDKNKVPLPRFINSIGVVTSKTGAVLQDIKNVSFRRNPNLEIYVYDAQVQGKMAVNDIIQGITYFDNLTDVDVIVVARGGGSLEDLSVFNDEELARVAYICNKPLISAVGHETDFSILDFVADLRAPTPSSAAELVTFDSSELKRYILELNNKIDATLSNNLASVTNQVNDYAMSIESQVNSAINDETLYILDLFNNIQANIDNELNNTIYRVNLSLNTLDKLNPIKLLRSGYSYVSTDGKPINYNNTRIGNNVKIVATDVIILAKIENKEKRND